MILLSKMKKIINKNWEKKMQELENFLELYLIKKAPTLPLGVKKFIVTVWPYFLLFGLIFTIPFVLMVIGLRFLIPSFLINGSEFHFDFFMLFSVAIFVIEAFALPGIFKRKFSGWKLAYYARLVNALGLILTFNIFGLIIGTTISLYFLFQVKEFYK